MEELFEWLTSLPPAALYLSLAGAAALENFFPPVPADSVVAFGSFLAARGNATLGGAFLATWAGNVLGAIAVYWIAHFFGETGPVRRLLGYAGAESLQRFQGMYQQRGTIAVFLSRFLPGARALVPPLAGLLRVPFGRVAVAIAVASAIWYGTIAWVAYSAGANWEVIQGRLASVSRSFAVVAAVIALVIVAVVLLRRRQRPRP